MRKSIARRLRPARAAGGGGIAGRRGDGMKSLRREKLAEQPGVRRPLVVVVRVHDEMQLGALASELSDAGNPLQQLLARVPVVEPLRRGPRALLPGFAVAPVEADESGVRRGDRNWRHRGWEPLRL